MDKITLEITKDEKQVLLFGLASYLTIVKGTGLPSEEAEKQILELHKKIRETNTGG